MRKLITRQMLMFEFRNIIRNPYIHIFGVGMPIMMMILICRVVTSQIPDETILANAVTSVFLGLGTMIPMATVLIGYGADHARELEKEIPLRMELFGIKVGMSLCNNIVAEMIFMSISFILYFVVGFCFVGVNTPTVGGLLIYFVCILVLSIILFGLSYAISSLLKKFGTTYCVTMLLYFAFMILGGMMGISYDTLPEGLKLIAKLLPITYINRDFYMVWNGEQYNFMPMVQAFLMLGAVSGILLFLAVKHMARKRHRRVA